jgi:chromosome segregation ATPase
MIEALENCIELCESLLNALVHGENIPTEESINAARYRVWTISETINELRRRIEQYNRQIRELTQTEAEMNGRIRSSQAAIDALRHELTRLQKVCNELQQEQDVLRHRLDETSTRYHRLKEKTPPAVPERRDEDASDEDLAALVSTLEQQNETALGLR